MRLVRDQRGAILLLGLFMAVFLAGCLYYLMGIGEAILQREGMQDAADAAAWNAATLHARGMNTLVLINMTMAALLAILVTLKLVEAVTIVLMVAIGVASFFMPGLSTTIPKIRKVQQTVRQTHDRAKRVIDPTLEALTAISRGVRVVVPWSTQARVVQQARAHHAPPALGAVAIPTRTTLPVEDGEYLTLCTHAGDYTGDLVKAPFELIGIDLLGDLVDGAVRDLTRGGSQWFCGVGSAPSTTVEQRIGYPKLPAREACEAATSNAASSASPQAEARCQEAEDEEERARFDTRTGECMQDCRPGEPYDLRDALAREACNPREHRHRRSYAWQQRRVIYAVTSRDGQLAREVQEEELRAQTHRRPPCGRRVRFTTVYDWNERQYGEDDQLLPVCSEGEPFPQQLAPGERVLVERQEVLRVFGCEQVSRREVEVGEAGDQPSEEEASRRVPQRIAEGAELGGEDFQLRSVAVGSLPRRGPEGALAVSAWGQVEQRSTALAGARALGRVASAQAEFYFAGPPDHRARYLWELSWRARLRRLRAAEGQPQAADEGGDARTATTLGAACSMFGLPAESCDVASTITGLVIH